MTLQFLCNKTVLWTSTFDTQDEADAAGIRWIDQGHLYHSFRVIEVESVVDEAHPQIDPEPVHDHSPEVLDPESSN